MLFSLMDFYNIARFGGKNYTSFNSFSIIKSTRSTFPEVSRLTPFELAAFPWVETSTAPEGLMISLLIL